MSYIEEHRSKVFLVDDKEWVTQRKQEWKLVKANLNKMGAIPKRLHKYHKEFFFTGHLEEPVMPPSPFAGVKALFLMWYWPEKKLDAYKAIFIDNYQDAMRIPRFLNSICAPENFTTEYSIFGGREELIVKAVCPFLDYKTVIFEKPNNSPVIGFGPSWLVAFVENQTRHLLTAQDVCVYAPGQYLWPQFDYAFEHYFDYIVKNKDWNTREKFFKRTLRYLLMFEDRDDFENIHPHVKSFRDELFNKFENGEFCQRLLDYYAEQKSEYEQGAPFPS
ncbi:hypothetical protein [Pleionea mediterranea]|uniref:Uncharacterized protein n=1 Tax=Pleionea mediterranea TaxID=523701 RepID=A0A316FTZ5_9GAMM|nr:hypothetical protein [Pleionea mediterranea]PWK51742.1 hypothetical protein C8D97_10557 [Pleionea mediterranea]